MVPLVYEGKHVGEGSDKEVKLWGLERTAYLSTPIYWGILFYVRWIITA